MASASLTGFRGGFAVDVARESRHCVRREPASRSGERPARAPLVDAARRSPTIGRAGVSRRTWAVRWDRCGLLLAAVAVVSGLLALSTEQRTRKCPLGRCGGRLRCRSRRCRRDGRRARPGAPRGVADRWRRRCSVPAGAGLRCTESARAGRGSPRRSIGRRHPSPDGCTRHRPPHGTGLTERHGLSRL